MNARKRTRFSFNSAEPEEEEEDVQREEPKTKKRKGKVTFAEEARKVRMLRQEASLLLTLSLSM